MSAPITLLIPTHNRHQYLRRAISYYKDFEYPILVLDSSDENFDLDINAPVKYRHLPGMPLPEKLYVGFCAIDTEFVVMCADDDFLITRGLNACLEYLQKNPDYAVADGSYLFYKKDDIFRDKINFNLLYKRGLDADFTSENVLERLDDFFKDYRTVFYGVHRTKNLRDAFGYCRHSYTNLYLNEYLTALLPVAMGNCRFIPILMGIRESTFNSDDKTTKNIDSMFTDNKADKVLQSYISCVSEAIHKKTGIMQEQISETLTNTFKFFAQTLHKLKYIDLLQNKKLSKRIGLLLNKFPLIGVWLIKQRRIKISRRELSILIKSEADERSLKIVEEKIRQFQSTC